MNEQNKNDKGIEHMVDSAVRIHLELRKRFGKNYMDALTSVQPMKEPTGGPAFFMDFKYTKK
jgi:hypothetical protein